MDSNPICHLQPKKWNAHFWITFNFWWLAGLVHGLKPYPPHLEMLIFGLHSTDDWPGWSMDSNPIHHHSPAKKIKCSFLDYIQLSDDPGLVDGLEPHLPPLSSQKNKMLIFGLHSTSDDRPGWSMDSNPICHPSPAKKIKCSFLDFQLLINGLEQLSEMLDYIQLLPGWSMDSNPIHHTSPAKKIKCSFLDYVHFWMIGQASMDSNPICHPCQKNHFWITDDRPGWSMDLNPICHPSPAKKIKCSFFGLRSTSDDRPGWSMDWNPIRHSSPAKKIKFLF